MQTRDTLKTALVTGGARGIGAGISRALAADGWFVYINYSRSKAEAETLAEELGGRAVCADMRDGEAAEAMLRELGDIALLCNNAGCAHYGLLQDMTDEEWRRLFSLNTDAMFRACRAVIPGMVRRKSGCIINLSSVWGARGGSCETAYSATKGAVIAFTRSLACELGPSGIRVNAICPGVIDTAMIANLTEEDRRELADETPLCRLGTPEDVGALAAFLASERASFITGQAIGCDGGFGV